MQPCTPVVRPSRVSRRKEVTKARHNHLVTTSREPRSARAPRGSRPSRRRVVLTGRAIALIIALSVSLLTIAGPVQNLIAQRSQINSLQSDIERRTAAIADLKQRQARLQDPAYIARLARERLHFVMPGEVGYVVLEPGEEAAAGVPLDPMTQAKLGPWWTRLWQGVRLADDPTIANP